MISVMKYVKQTVRDQLHAEQWCFCKLFIIHPFKLYKCYCKTLFFLHIFFAHLIVFCTSYCFLHILLFCTFFYFIAHFTLISPFLTICMPLCYVTLYNLYSYYFALSYFRTWFDYISLLIIPCITIMWQIKKPWPWPWFLNHSYKRPLWGIFF